MAEVVGMAVSMAGSIAGGKAAQAIMGTPISGPDTTIPGVTSATIKKGAKGQPDQAIPQVDISQSLAWFREAADAQANAYQQGLDYYTNALKQAANEIKAGYAKSNATLAPISFASTQALNEQMRMMGLDPMPATASLSGTLKDMGIKPEIANQIDMAAKIKDPAARAQAKQDIISSIANQKQSLNLDEIRTSLGPRPDSDSLQYQTKKVGAPSGPTAEWNAYVDAQKQATAAWDSKYNDLVASKKADMVKNNTMLDAISSQFNNTYADTYDAGYTGQQVTDRITSTPGYKFQLDQGTQAVERQGAAKGMLGSGNTLIALQNYGQGLAQNYYGMYMDNLARITAEGSGATSQIAANQAQEGRDYGALWQAGGEAGMKTYGAIGDAKAQSLYNQGNLYADAAKFNTSLQFNGIQADLNRKAEAEKQAKDNQMKQQQMNSQVQQQAIASLPSLMNATTAQQQFNYGLFQNQQGGKAYYA